MSFADSFERRFLFVLTRGLALLFIFGLLAAIVIGGIIVSDKLMPKESTLVSLTMMRCCLHPTVVVRDAQ